MAEKNKVRFGLSKLHIFFKAVDGWDEPIAVPGVTECTLNSQVKSKDFYADNVLYFRSNADTGDEITVTTAFFPDAVKARMLGWAIDEHGALVRVTDGVPEEFAMAFQVEGDKKPRAKVIYSCIASVPNENATTKGEDIEVQTEQLNIRSKAIEVAGHKTVDAVLNESDDPDAFATFFDTVYVPSYATTAQTTGGEGNENTEDEGNGEG